MNKKLKEHLTNFETRLSTLYACKPVDQDDLAKVLREFFSFFDNTVIPGYLLDIMKSMGHCASCYGQIKRGEDQYCSDCYLKENDKCDNCDEKVHP